MLMLCEGCTAPPPEAMIIVYAALAFPFVASFAAGCCFWAFAVWLVGRSPRQ
jgi:hypothetical protein